MKETSLPRNAFLNPRVRFRSALPPGGVLLALLSLSLYASASAQSSNKSLGRPMVIPSYHNDVSKPLRDMPAWPEQARAEHEAAENPLIVVPHTDAPDLKVDKGTLLSQLAPSIPAPILNFAGISFPGVGCNCAPPDTNGEVGATQYVQIVNEGYQVFNKSNGASVLGPVSISSVWSGFGGACQNGGSGDPVVLYDQIAKRWIISQFAVATNVPTDECIAVSTTSDATGSYNRYGFHLGSNFFDYPHLAVWPDGYYMSMNIFNSRGTAYLGPQAFAFDRTKMLAGQPATFITFPAMGGTFPPFLPADLDGATLPPAGAPNSFVMWPSNNTYRTFHFHADFANPASSSLTLFSSPPAAGFTELCPATRSCVPQSGANVNTNGLDAIADRLMFRLAYRNFGGHEAVVGNYTVNSSGVAGIRWFELRGVTSGPETVFQESTYQPDLDWRWMGSLAMDSQGNMALGFSASSATIFPQIRYAGRLASDPLNTLAQGEKHLFDGTGAQVNTGNRWGDYSDLTVDPVDDTTFWYTQEYYDSTSSFNWRTRVGSFRLASSGGGNTVVSAASRLTHGSAGTFDINMPLSGASGIEDRSASTYNAVFTFGVPVTSGRVTVVSGSATVGTPTFSGNSLIVPLTGITTPEVVTLRVRNINGDGQQDGDVPFGFLVGDVNAGRKVNSTDVGIVRADLGQTVTSANFRADVNATGRINKMDVGVVRAAVGTSLP